MVKPGELSLLLSLCVVYFIPMCCIFSPHSDFVVVVVQSLSCIWLFVTPWTAACQASLSFTISWSLLKLMFIELVMPSNHLILYPPAFNLSQHQGLFQWVSSLHQVAKVLEFQHQSFHEYSGLIFFRINWVWSPGCPRDSQESMPAPQFKSINSFFYFSLFFSVHFHSIFPWFSPVPILTLQLTTRSAQSAIGK